MSIEFKIGVDYSCNLDKKPDLNVSVIDSNDNQLPITKLDDISYTVDIHDYEPNSYVLELEHTNAVYPQDYLNGDFGIDIKSLYINGVDLNDLIHRRGHCYMDCTNNSYYVLEQINNNNFIVNDYKLLNYRHNHVKYDKPKVFDHTNNELIEYSGVFVTDSGYIIKGNKMYYDATADINFIKENSDNDYLYIKDDKLMHHVPNSSCLNLNGVWRLKFETPLYGWVVDNIFGNDLA